MDVWQIIRVLRARWALSVLLAVVGLGAALAAALVMQPVYRSTAEVLVNVRAPETVGNTSLADQLSPEYLATQLDVIRSDRVARMVVAKLQLAHDPAAMKSLGWHEQGGSVEESLAHVLVKKLDVESGKMSSRVLAIRYAARDPILAARIANGFAQAYVDASLDLQAQPAKASASWYQRQSQDLQSQLAAVQAKLSARQRELGVVASDGQPDAEEGRLQTLSAQLADAQARNAAALAEAGAGALPNALSNPVVQGIQTEIAKLEAQRQQLATTAGPNNPDYRQIVAQLSGLKEQLATQRGLVQHSASATAAQTGSSVAALNAVVAAQKQRVIANQARLDDIGALQQDARNLRTVYDQMATRKSQLDLLGESSQSNIAILSPATTPPLPSGPRRSLLIAGGLIVGATLGMLLSLVLEYFRWTLRSADDLESWYGIPNLGTLRLGSAAVPAMGGGIRMLLGRRGGQAGD